MIIPGIFENDLEEIKKKITLVEQFTTVVQIDVADGVLVDGETFDDLKKLEEIKTKVSFEIHLMVSNPLKYLMYEIKNVEKMCMQVEASDYVRDFLTMGGNYKYKLGLSLNPKTPIETLNPYMNMINYVQFMTVIPGGQGRPFDYNVLAKISEFKSKYPFFPTQVDGGIDASTLQLVLRTGVNNIIIGSQLFNAQDVREAYIKFSMGELNE